MLSTRQWILRPRGSFAFAPGVAVTTYRPLRLLWIALALALTSLPACQPQKQLHAEDVPQESAELEAPPIEENVESPAIDDNIVPLSNCAFMDTDICEDPSGCGPIDVITNLSPTFTWTYGCNPDAYGITLSREGLQYPQFVEHIDEFDEEVGGPRRSWTPSRQLDPGSHYYWSVHSLISTWNGVDTPSYYYETFWTGPRCDPATMEPPDLTQPFVGSEFDPGEIVNLSWEWLQDGCIPDGYEPQLSRKSNFSELVPLEYDPTIPQGLARTQEGVQACKTYYWRVGAISQGEHGPFSGPRSFKVNGGGSFCLYAHLFRVAKQAVCRLGYSAEYPAVRYYEVGEELEITGRNRQKTWLKLGDCWIAASLGEVEGDLEEVQILSAPPLPTPTEEPLKCTPKLDKGDCKEAGGEWVGSLAGKPYCKCP
jgi:hypothetical protein